ncbi:winged helix-turn-helix domain-containing protein [Kluyvera intermedia]|uniref:OmpR/PhoB-type domain-containing protein n=1 Tax=Kluyvera intermedia TaxID=61648 RepID=A0ABX6DHI8_KLUIN|nr:winged helix-turn-helix domain-containing protein [Kluyvera intermedia]QGH28248.1 hypothetical protein GHC21_00610 [Kluyvera intermedia]QGH37230.1 hypothetical protein GHC38_00610 [Kluyvera intermedia]
MKYLINDRVLYDTERDVLQDCNGIFEEVALSPRSVSLLLSYLIGQTGVLLPKAELGTNALTGTGYSGSESNINKSISLLRRSFKDLGIDGNIIKTIPGEGFVFDATVEEYKVNNKKRKKTVFIDLFIKRKSIILMTTSFFLISLIYLFYLNSVDCIIINNGEDVKKHEVMSLFPEFKTCKMNSVTVNSAHSDNKRQYILTSNCHEDNNYCTNNIRVHNYD